MDGNLSSKFKDNLMKGPFAEVWAGLREPAWNGERHSGTSYRGKQ